MDARAASPPLLPRASDPRPLQTRACEVPKARVRGPSPPEPSPRTGPVAARRGPQCADVSPPRRSMRSGSGRATPHRPPETTGHALIAHFTTGGTRSSFRPGGLRWRKPHRKPPEARTGDPRNPLSTASMCGHNRQHLITTLRGTSLTVASHYMRPTALWMAPVAIARVGSSSEEAEAMSSIDGWSNMVCAAS